MSRKTYRDSYVSAHISNTVASQIEAMREARGWTQTDLAAKIGTKQSRVSVLENPDNPNFEVRTLLKVASAFDVGLSVRFVPFSEVVEWADNLIPEKLVATEFANDSIVQPVSSVLFPWDSLLPPSGDANDVLIEKSFRRGLASSAYQDSLAGMAGTCQVCTYPSAEQLRGETGHILFRTNRPVTIHVDSTQKQQPQNAMIAHEIFCGRKVLGLVE